MIIALRSHGETENFGSDNCPRGDWNAMTVRDRFFGKGTAKVGELPVANPRLTDPPGFGVLYELQPSLSADGLTRALRDYHPDLAGATAELFQEGATTLGLIGWGRHVVKFAIFDRPMPPEAVEKCVVPAHYDPALKEAAARHVAHVMLFYTGYEEDPHEQHVALAAAAAAVAHNGALVVVNEAGRTSIPAVALLPHEEDNGDTLRTLRTFPIPLLYAGFVKIELDGEPGVWMRTCGCHALNLPDLAFLADDHGQGTATFNLFSGVLAQVREQKITFQPGDVLNLGEGMYLRLRERTESEWFLESEGQMLVAERVVAEEVRQ